MTTPTLRMTTLLVANLIGGLCAALLLLGLVARADQDATTDSVPRQLPYHGTLTFEGDPVTAVGDDARWLRFDIFDAGEQVYTQSVQVEVFDGRFSTVLGPIGDAGESLEVGLGGADDLTVSITLLGDPADEGDDIAMSGSQRLALTPFAVWATHGHRFDVGASLTVGGDVDVVQTSGETTSTVASDITGVVAINPSGGVVDASSARASANAGLTVAGDTVSFLPVTASTFSGRNALVGRVTAPLAQLDALEATQINGAESVNVDGTTATFGGDVRLDSGMTLRSGTAPGVTFAGPTAASIGFESNAISSTLEFTNDGVGNDFEFYVVADRVMRIDETHGISATGSTNLRVVTDINDGGSYHPAGVTGGNFSCRSAACGMDEYTLATGYSTDNPQVPQNWVNCPIDTYACGLQQQIDNDGDHAGVTAYRMFCCHF